jgi:hypothetical protein
VAKKPKLQHKRKIRKWRKVSALSSGTNETYNHLIPNAVIPEETFL